MKRFEHITEVVYVSVDNINAALNDKLREYSIRGYELVSACPSRVGNNQNQVNFVGYRLFFKREVEDE